jgi:hypothetical protein
VHTNHGHLCPPATQKKINSLKRKIGTLDASQILSSYLLAGLGTCSPGRQDPGAHACSLCSNTSRSPAPPLSQSNPVISPEKIMIQLWLWVAHHHELHGDIITAVMLLQKYGTEAQSEPSWETEEWCSTTLALVWNLGPSVQLLCPHHQPKSLMVLFNTESKIEENLRNHSWSVLFAIINTQT